MPYELKKISVKSTDNIHTLSGRLYIPDGEIKGIFHLVHGMCEYIGRYDHVMSEIAENGYVCCGYDNLGHGETAKDDSELGFFAHRDGWKHLVNDVIAFEDAVKKMFPQDKLFLMGHSMGSFIARLAAEDLQKKLSGLIICGTGGPVPFSFLGLLYVNLLKKVKGEKYVSGIADKIAFGAFNKRFEPRTGYEWLTKDREIVDKFVNDKYCNFKFTVSAMGDLMKLVRLSNRKKWFDNIDKTLPILIISGADDPVGNYGKAIKGIYNRLTDAGCKNVSMKLYENCRHEIHNDTCKNETISDIIKFIEIN